MTDETRDALLLAVAEAVTRGIPVGPDVFLYIVPFDDCRKIEALLARARHEQQYPEDRG